MSWQSVKLSSICSFKTGKLNSNAAVEGGIYPFFTCAQETYFINEAAFNTEAVLLGGNNANGVYPLKYYCGEFNAYQRTYIIEAVDKEVLDVRFLYYSLSLALDHFQKASIGAATQYLTKPVLDNFQIKLPEINQQKRLVGVISHYDDLIENNRRRIQLLEESARLLYKEWFVHLRFPGHEHVKIVDGVPEGWNRVSLADVCIDIKDSVNPEAIDSNTPYIGLEHMPRRSITLDTWETSDKVTSNKFIFKENDIIFGKIRPYFHKIGFALCSGVTSSDAVVIRPLSQNLYFYCLMYLSSDYFIALASKTVKEGSKMPRADWKYLLTTELFFPSEVLLRDFNEQVEPITKQLKALSLQNQALVKARDLLLPKLMSGEIAV